MQKKRIMTCIILVSMLLSCFTGAIHATETEVMFSDADFNVAKKLNTIGIIDIVSEEEMSHIPTREECAQLMVRFMNIPLSGMESNETPFFDVSSSRKGAAAITALYNMGYVSRGEDLKFYPDRNVTANEAITFVIKAMGYGVMAERNGSYPTGYFNAANRYGILNGLSLVGSETIRMIDLYYMIDAALDAPAYSYTGTSGNYDEYEFNESYTILNDYHKMDKISGIVTANSVTMLKSTNSTLGEAEIKIGDAVYTYTENADKILGKAVVAYVLLNDEETNSVVYLEEDSKKNSTAKLKYDSLVANKTTDTKLAYKDGDKIKYEDLESNCYVIYNGKSRTSFYALSNILPAYGHVEVIDNDKNGKADVLKIENYTTMIVSHVDTFDNVIYDINDSTKNINFGDNKVILYVIDGATGEDISAASLERGCVLSVVMSEDKKLIKCYASFETVSGTISAVSQENGKNVYTIGNAAYKKVPDRNDLDISLGKIGAFGLDYFGAIASYSYDADLQDGFKYGVIVGIEPKVGLDDGYILKVFSENGKFVIYPAKERIKIDGATKKITDIAVKTLLESQLGNMMRYRVANGEISEFDFASVVDVEAGQISAEMGTLTQISETARIERRSNVYAPNANFSFYAPANETKVLVVPTTLTDDECYGVYTAAQVFTNNYVMSAVSTGGNYNKVINGMNVKGYNLGVEKDAPNEVSIFLMRADDYIANSSTVRYVVASEITTVYDKENDRETHRVYFNGTGEYMDIAQRFKSHNYVGIQSFTEINLKPGDLFTYSTDGKGKIAYIRVWYRSNPEPGDKTSLSTNSPLSGSSFDGDNVRGIARITGKDVNNKVISIKTIDGAKQWSFTYTTPQVWMVSDNGSGQKLVSAISVDSLMVGDYIVFRSAGAVCQDIVVYR